MGQRLKRIERALKHGKASARGWLRDFDVDYTAAKAKWFADWSGQPATAALEDKLKELKQRWP